MDILIYLIPFSILIALVGVVGLFWAINNKQYDDLQGSAERILFDEEEKKEKK